MRHEQLQDEKLSVQKTLLQFESTFGRPVGFFVMSIFKVAFLCSSLLLSFLPVTVFDCVEIYLSQSLTNRHYNDNHKNRV